MQIRSVVLYNRQGEIRQIDFPLGSLCIVTGASKTGKSALIEIVDYCLGRESCTVPVGVIRDTVSWFAVLFQFPDLQYFVARKTPAEGQQYESDVYIQSGSMVGIPTFEQLKPNANTISLESQLTESLVIAPNLNVSATSPSDEKAFRIGVRHTTFVIFQQQDEIASKRLLFHRQGDEFIPHAIRQTLPYFIGAAEEDRLIKQNELERLRKECEDIEKRIQEYERSVGNIDRARDLLREASEVGLFEHKELPSDRAHIDASLAAALKQPVADVPAISDDNVDHLQRERLHLLREYRDLREEARAAEEFEREQLGYREELDVQTARLRSVGLFREDDPPDICPVCFSQPQNPTPSQVQMRQMLEDFQRKLGRVQKQVTNVREHIVGIYSQLAELKKQINQNWVSLTAATVASRVLAEQENVNRRRSYVTGRISLYLQSRQEIFGGEPLEEILTTKKRRVQQLDEELNRAEVIEKQTSILNAIGARMSEWGKKLSLEFGTSPLRIDIKKLSVVADTAQGPVPLDRMGSAENWVGYHLVAFAALHTHFINENRPTPRFLMLDQPSQVYFPQERPMRAQAEKRDEDELAVLRMFQFLAEVVRSMDGKFQIIVTDHADLVDEFFQAAVVQRWRNGEALIPIQWVSSPQTTELPS
jgi:archaellum component FlaC